MLTFEQLSKFKYIDKFCYKCDPETASFHIKIGIRNSPYVISFLRCINLECDIETMFEYKYLVVYLHSVYKNKWKPDEWFFQPVSNKMESINFSKLSMNAKMNYRFVYLCGKV